MAHPRVGSAVALVRKENRKHVRDSEEKSIPKQLVTLREIKEILGANCLLYITLFSV